MVEIIEYEEKYFQDFKKLNLEWLDKYQLTESHDLLILNNPQKMILERGGFIWLAKAEYEIIGSAAIVNEGEGIFQLAKLSVTQSWQGNRIGQLLIETCLLKVRAVGAKKIVLFSNHQLTKALSLYKKYGFKHIEVVESPFLTSDVKMELVL
ncbi:MAG: N-acetyltransferase [Chitinophagaceae bacterium]|nr:MAG: N-acetyltransferase [Chitinophagaceae bacterium]